MNKIRQTPQSRRLSAYEERDYVIPKLFLSVDLYQKQQHSVRIASNQVINNLTFIRRNINYQPTQRSIQSELELLPMEENNKVFEVKIKIKFTKHKQKLEKQIKQDFHEDYKIVKFPKSTIQQVNDEVELSRKLQKLFSTITK